MRPLSYTTVVNDEGICLVDITDLEDGIIFVWTVDDCFLLRDIVAFDLLMRLAPQCLEGKRLRWFRHAWAFHNLVAHPAMQLLAFLGMGKLGVKIHDLTIPRPVGKKKP